MVEVAKNLDGVLNLAVGVAKGPSIPRSQVQCPLCEPKSCARLTGAPYKEKGSTLMSEQQPSSTLIICHVKNQPTIKIILGG